MPPSASLFAPDVTTSPRSFAVTWDYRCPFARNVHEHLVTALRGGAPWDVTFLPFSLGQVHVEEGAPPIWDRWQDDSGLLALQAGTVVRDKAPERFLDVHEALFALRHDHGGRLRDEAAVREVLAAHEVDDDMVLAEIEQGRALEIVREEHERAVTRWNVWGVPTFVTDGRAAFLRIMHRPEGDVAEATRTIERVLDLLTWSELNELKHTTIPR